LWLVHYWEISLVLRVTRKRFFSFAFTPYGNIFTIVSNKLEIIGMDIDTIITFPPMSTLFAIALSPVSLHMLTANSVRNAMPVILISNFKNSLFIDALFESEVKRSTIPLILSIRNNRI